MVTHSPKKQKAEFPGLELGHYFGASEQGKRILSSQDSLHKVWGQVSQRPSFESKAPSVAGAWPSLLPPLRRGAQGSPLYILPDGESPGLLLDFLPRRVRNRSLTNLASSSSARFFFLSSSEMLISGSWSFTRSMTCPAGSAEGGTAPGVRAMESLAPG